ncbi:hypothetical protein BV509_17715 [Rhodovulum sulfidophilum]|uniref:Uncharacterized protein n=1 Tax=Rhodovulum visakhapatnamense TaxID=364297 RepID=A0ABS1RM72_9RHOB|nr:hypothetical protein [Rhodovulum visakhapatnamense]MBL3572051.1 hypothetical protein [Rhodovulum visakhapatnamense]MBL3580750.1 hypothetical protein [Rhodovulum visakhapatnamense]OLS46012.1 hypothetical protein BV509_17715 [Rhodovulum sulfidophilum]
MAEAPLTRADQVLIAAAAALALPPVLGRDVTERRLMMAREVLPHIDAAGPLSGLTFEIELLDRALRTGDRAAFSDGQWRLRGVMARFFETRAAHAYERWRRETGQA